ncbi:MAG: ParB/RepB/Spo0J family partition protein [Bacteroidetes bacterium]|nr:MAG: ParB/RepB/Spo0J family partition protein [Bacteroidota bacterium]
MSKKKSALGKGLGALLPTESIDETPASDLSKTRLYNFEDRIRATRQTNEVSIDLIDPNPYQPRTSFDSEGLEELAASIRQLGIIQPVTLRAVSSGRYQLISGERRLRAAEMAGLSSLPSYVREADSEAMLEMALVENLQRKSLNPIEISLGYQRLIDECGLTQDKVADKVGKNRTTVANFLRLLKLPPEVQAALKREEVTVGHARALLALDSDQKKIAFLRQIKSKGLSVRAVEDEIRKMLTGAGKNGQSKKRNSNSGYLEEPAVRQLRDRLRNRLSTQVVIHRKVNADGGRIEVEYYSDDDLDRLVELMAG